MTGTLTAGEARELIRRGRCATCTGRFLAVSHADGGQSVQCFSCGREAAAIGTGRPDATAPYWADRLP